ncbi:MAG: VanZ family protein [Deltaproteobacteria bacterium]|nr:VanZ family protein [Deltaproteobacteria bacterium]MBW2072451.1 VanZ family protein [Deltaproteobacteria bacterium]
MIDIPRSDIHRFCFPRMWLIGGWLYVALIIVLSLIPTPPPVASFPLSDKAGHFLVYMMLMFWFAQLYRELAWQVCFCLVFILMGAALEAAQIMVPGRSCEYADVVANSLGVVLGALAARTFAGNFLAFLDAKLGRFIHWCHKL